MSTPGGPAPHFDRKEPEMTYLTRVALCLLSLLAIGALGASAASAALPEFAGGPIPQPFSSTASKTTLETVGGVKLTCTSGTDSGKVTGPKTLEVSINLTGCSIKKIACKSPNGVAGEVQTAVLTGVLGYISKPKKQVGVDLLSPAGAPLTSFFCGAAMRVGVVGSVIGRITPINKLVTPPAKFALHFVQAKGKQNPNKLEGEPVDVLESSINGGPVEESGLSSTDMLSFAAPLEVKA
jgi:hypothetical protein